MTNDQALALARFCAQGHMPRHEAAELQPPEWVLQAIRTAATNTKEAHVAVLGERGVLFGLVQEAMDVLDTGLLDTEASDDSEAMIDELVERMRRVVVGIQQVNASACARGAA
jgi:hypothetical protein